uniref:Cap-specific mRNA (nucleoside-2'-O-)-methyltransferase 1 n=1 Tax=Timema californicum TaxID=61474 RepID=A0A7R9P3X3_TIMCA|nr:unnamed protein product [Timema californicum]
MSHLGMRGSNLSDSSENESSDDNAASGPPQRKRHHSMFPHSGENFEIQDESSSDSQDEFSHMPNINEFPTTSKNNFTNNMVQYSEEPNVKGNTAQKIMERMGYKAGRGLGKHDQGRVDPVEMSKQRGRRGLGLHIPGLEAATLVWKSDLEVITHEEHVNWLEDEEHSSLSAEIMEDWIVEGKPKLVIDDETNFCDSNILRNVISGKNVFDQLDPHEMMKARTRSNPFETIRGGIFLNRAAMKMANMDKVFDFMFTKPVDEMGESLVAPGELLYFADVCAGPGGFSEYVLWRCGWQAKGFGFTLRAQNDFKLSNFYAGHCETFETHYGVGGSEGDGDVFKQENINCFSEHVISQTNGQGVHFMMADGGFSVEGQENIQEILSKELYLCQFIVALCIVRNKGHFVCKLFDVFTPFSVGLIYLMYKAFRKISIHKPNTSRPANSERYIICKWKRSDSTAIKEHLINIHEQLQECRKIAKDITEVVPISVLNEDRVFFDYIVTSNNSIGEKQVIGLVKIAAFCRDINLIEPLQAEIKKQCLDYWEVPDKARTAPPRISETVKCEQLLKNSSIPSNVFSKEEIELKPTMMEGVFQSVYDWHCVVLGSSRERKNCTFYLGMGRNKVYRFEEGRWRKVVELIELSPDTLFYGEIVQELHGEGRSQRKIPILHIIDAIFLGGKDISKRHITERLKLCHKFCQALNKSTRTDLMPIRTKQLFDLEYIDQVFDRLKMRSVKNAALRQEKGCTCRANNPSILVRRTAEGDKSSWPLAQVTSSVLTSTTRPSIPECAICLQMCVHPAQLPCGHIFCFLCVKGVANQSKKCAMCRQEIPTDYLEKPQLLEQSNVEKVAGEFDDGYQWFYEGRNGWWQYEERTSADIEEVFKLGEPS